GDVRATGIESDADPSDGARFWMGEASADAPFEELRTTKRELMAIKWTSPGALGHAGWRTIRRVFVTGPETRFLHLVCNLAAKHDVRDGSVEFADVRVVASPIETFWKEELASATA